MQLHLPNSAFLGNIDPFLRGFNPSEPGHLTITANPKWISVHPVILAMLAALADRLHKQNIVIDKLEAKSRNYFERMSLFRYLGIDSGIVITSHDSSGRFVPIAQIRDSLALTEFVTDMVPLLHLEPHQAEPIRYIISELVRNVLEHAESSSGAFVAAQYYKKSNSIKIGIADNGIGIRASISHSHQAFSDIDAIRLALTPGVTGTTSQEGGSSENAGAGLFFTKTIARINNGRFMIYSGTGMYKLLKNNRDTLPSDPFSDRHTKHDDLPIWQGTAIGVDINLDNTPDFSSLLELMRQSLNAAIRERRSARRRSPRFI